MASPFIATFIVDGDETKPFDVVYDGSVHSISYFVHPYTATVISSGTSNVLNLNDSATLTLTGYGRYSGVVTSPTLRIVDSGSGPGGSTLDQVITRSNYQTSNSVTFSNLVTISNLFVPGELHVVGNLVTESKETLLISNPVLVIGSNLSQSFGVSNVALVMETPNGNSNVVIEYTPSNKLLGIGYTNNSTDSTDPRIDTSQNLDVCVYGNLVATGTYGLLDPKYLVGPPPQIVFQTPVVTSTSVIVPWKIPDQIHVGFSEKPLPLLVNLVSSYSGSDYDTKVFGNVITFTTGTSDTANGVYHVDPSFSGTSLNCYYTNYNSGYNANTISVPGFITGYPPSAPRNLGNTSPGTNVTVSYDEPLYRDAQNPANLPAIDKYTIQVSSSQLNSLITPSVSDSRTIIASGRSVDISVYPESNYSFEISANNISNTQNGPSDTLLVTTLPLQPVTEPTVSLFNGITFTTAYKTNGTPISTLILGSVTQVQDTIVLNIQNYNTRGTLNQSSSILTISDGTNALDYWYDNRSPNSTGSTLTCLSIQDSYSQTGYRGYYYTTNVTYTHPLVKNANEQTFTITKSTGKTYSKDYYYEGLVGNPDVSQGVLNFTAGTLNTVMISGISCIITDSTFNVSAPGFSNMGDYFKPQFPYVYQVLSSTFTSFTGNPQTIPVSVNSLIFSTSISCSLTVINVNGSTQGPTRTINQTIDVPSYAILQRADVKRIQLADPSVPSTEVASTYDNSQSLTLNQELQLANGSFCTAIPGVSFLNGYSSLITGTRYASFKFPYATGTNGLQIFMFHGISDVIGKNSSGITIGGQQITFYYRYIDESNPSSSYSSSWYNGSVPENLEGVTNDTIRVYKNNLLPPNGTSYLYCVIGLPMSVPISFNYITLV